MAPAGPPRRLARLGGPVNGLALRPGGRTGFALVGSSLRPGEEHVCGWDAAAGRESFRVAENRGWLNGLALSPDGSTLATLSDATVLRLWDARSGAPLAEAAVPGVRPNAVAFAPEGGSLAAAASGSQVLTGGSVLSVWGLSPLRRVGSTPVHRGEVTRIVFSPDGGRLVTCSEDRTACLMDAGRLRELLTLRPHADRVFAAAFSPDGRFLATSAGDRTVVVHDGSPLPDDGDDPRLEAAFSVGAGVTTTALGRGGTRLAAAEENGTVGVWDLASRERVGTAQAARPLRVALDFRGCRLAWVDWEHNVRVVDLDGGRVLLGTPPPPAERGAFNRGLCFDEAGGRLGVSAGWHERVVPLETTDAPVGWAGPAYNLSGAAVSPRGTLAAGADGRHLIRVRDAATGRVLHELAGHESEVRSIAFSHDDRLMVTAASDGAVLVWDARAGRLLRRLSGHADAVYQAAVSPDGRLAASGGEDRTVRVWNLETGEPVAVYHGHPEPVRAVAFARGGEAVAAVSVRAGRAEVRVWGVPPP